MPTCVRVEFNVSRVLCQEIAPAVPRIRLRRGYGGTGEYELTRML